MTLILYIFIKTIFSFINDYRYLTVLEIHHYSSVPRPVERPWGVMKTEPLLIWNLDKATEAYTMFWSGTSKQSEGMWTSPLILLLVPGLLGWLWLASCTASEAPQDTHPSLRTGTTQRSCAGCACWECAQGHRVTRPVPWGLPQLHNNFTKIFSGNGIEGECSESGVLWMHGAALCWH